MITNKIKLGIVGFGRIVELIHLPLLKKTAEIEVVGVYDITPQRRELAMNRGFQVYSDLDAMIDSDLDALLIATPPNSHYQIASNALRKGKHVLVEKPVTESLSEAEHLASLAKERGLILSVFQNRRYDPDFLFLKNYLATDMLGEILFVERRHHMFGSGASFGVKSFYPDWRKEARYGGGALLDWGVHLVDQLLQLNLGKVQQVDGRMTTLRWNQSEVEDCVQANLSLQNGITMLLEVNFGSNASLPMWVVGGDRATLQINSAKEAVLLQKGKPAEHLPISIDGLKDGAERIYSSFASCLLRGEENEIKPEEVIDTMKILDAIRISSKQKETVHGNTLFSSSS
ncbi:Gfo/Idh/MocA family protein [Paenibacillus sp. LPE1-1-1.1]|uniref:Gfo/Idh/MocA family protein n=1 Tax=Paenibacillus sp. LPE1-1-1.1 TaxID=3135230 RepID=UPI0034381A5B